MTKEPDRAFLGYIHDFRGFAMLAVVATHVTSALDWTHSIPLHERAIHAIIRNGTVPFVFVAGFLFQHLSARFEYRRYLATKLKNVIVPYLFVSIPALAYLLVRRAEIFEHVSLGNPLELAVVTGKALLTGGHMPIPLWFIPAISLLYLAAPLFIAIDRRPFLYWLLPVFIAIGMFVHRPLLHRLVWQSALYCLPAYLLGCWASRYRELLLPWLSRHRIAMATSFFLLMAIELFVLGRSGPIFSAHPFSTERGIVDIDLPAKLIASLSVLEILYANEGLLPTWLYSLAGTSFGIYFLHEYLIEAIAAIARRTPYPIEHHGVVAFVVLWVSITAASHLLVRLAQRVLGKRSRLIIGS